MVQIIAHLMAGYCVHRMACYFNYVWYFCLIFIMFMWQFNLIAVFTASVNLKCCLMNTEWVMKFRTINYQEAWILDIVEIAKETVFTFLWQTIESIWTLNKLCCWSCSLSYNLKCGVTQHPSVCRSNNQPGIVNP